jgi:hypothetical protein
MSELQVQPRFEATSASGAMLMRHVGKPVVLGYMLVGLGTSTAQAAERPMGSTAVGQTTSGAAVAGSPTANASLGELRRLTGLTWDQLARVFKVSRRSLHFWASGKPMAAANEEHLQRMLAVARKIDRGSASATRAALLDARDGGSLPFDLLAAGDYERVVSLLGSAETPRVRPPSLSAAVRAARAPLKPEELVGALHDPIHPASGPLRASKAVAVRRRK